eukprot:Hpha_TRINITY_DN17321_c0_g1::TRINITY_DN17321_c0_g1_i1::g.137909::m.137909
MEDRLARWERQKQLFLDKSVPFVTARYVALLLLAVLYAWRVYAIQGFYVVTYGLGLELLRLAVRFVSPLEDPEEQDDDEGESLPTHSSGEDFKPFIRKMPEFKVWYVASRAFLVCFGMTFFSIFDIPVFWPILAMYFIVLVVLTAKKQIAHMWKYKYVPWSSGKKKYKPDSGPSHLREYEGGGKLKD